jgi:hypothetical protein
MVRQQDALPALTRATHRTYSSGLILRTLRSPEAQTQAIKRTGHPCRTWSHRSHQSGVKPTKISPATPVGHCSPNLSSKIGATSFCCRARHVAVFHLSGPDRADNSPLTQGIGKGGETYRGGSAAADAQRRATKLRLTAMPRPFLTGAGFAWHTAGQGG